MFHYDTWLKMPQTDLKKKKFFLKTAVNAILNKTCGFLVFGVFFKMKKIKFIIYTPEATIAMFRYSHMMIITVRHLKMCKYTKQRQQNLDI